MSVPDIREQVDLIREVFAYTERFRGSTFVIKISNDIIDHPDFPQHARDLALLHKSGIRIVIIPGARKRIDEVLDRFGAEKEFVDGIRVSDPESMDLIKMAAFDVAHRVMTALSGHKITAVIGNWVRARSRGVVDGVDFRRTGLVDRIRVEAVTRSLELGHVPIFPCVGHNETGDPFNLSSDELASTVATALNARKLFLLTPNPVMGVPEWKVPEGVDILEDGRIFRMTPAAVKDILILNPDKMDRGALETAATACRGGIDRAHILDGRQGGVLLKEIFSNLGVGTMVFADAYERLRPMESSDVPGVMEIMRPLIAEGILVERTREELERKQERTIGCTPWTEWFTGAPQSTPGVSEAPKSPVWPSIPVTPSWESEPNSYPASARKPRTTVSRKFSSSPPGPPTGSWPGASGKDALQICLPNGARITMKAETPVS